MHASQFVFAAVALAAAASVQAQVITVGANVNVTKLTGSQEETAIAIDRANSSLIAISSNSQAGLVTRFSTNAGSTWSASNSITTNGGYDSWMGADQYGNIFLSYQENQVTKIARSIDGGATYGAVATIAGSGADHPESGVGPGFAAGTNSYYLRDSVGGQSRVITATSSGLGVSTGYTVATGQGAGNFGSTAVGPGGRTIFTTMSPEGSVGPTNMVLRYDADGTGPGGYMVQNTITSNVGGFRPIPAQPSRTVDAQVALKYDFSGGAHNGDLYMLYTQAANTTTNDTNIVFRRSSNNGATFSSEVKLNTDSGTNSQFFGRLAVDQKTGWLASVWYDARDSADNTKVGLWGTVSIDGGLTWAPNFKISAGLSDGRATNTGDGNEFGDYISLDFYDGKLVTAWADSSNSTGDNPNGTSGLDVYFAQVLVSAAIPEPSTYLLMALGLVALRFKSRRGG